MTDSIGTLTIADFIEARIAEDEEGARAAATPSSDRWSVTKVPYEGIVVWQHGDDPLPGHTDGQTEHIARHDPARVLRQCIGLRALIRSLIDAIEDEMPGFERVSEERLVVELGATAAIWSDHADYRQEWAL